ncbi:cytochrome P450 [Streptomyces silvisoli]|uniref:Cytochrome P450 n=1 Tax=Streptomyces silvisoli TaxID=3034235 RepID=A0ABT5ZJX5_9ACTN|nr:cytochrome P450 [Streptomyces silvisoli]MDF3290131.1 cytochrome P450 [Streptomyces silvisoli]
MTTQQPPSCPAHGDTPPVVQLYGPQFAANPQAFYAHLRLYGPLAPVEIAPGVDALLVTDRQVALDLLRDTSTWSKDPRRWQATIPPDSPVLPMLAWRRNVLFSDGEAHARYRRVVVDAFDFVEPHELRLLVQHCADRLIREFGGAGHCDLIAQYARSLPLLIFNALFGLPDHYSERLIAALAGMLEGNSPEEAAEANAAYGQYVRELVTLKRQQRGDDVTSWFMHHPAGLSTEELVDQVILTMGAGHEPTTNLIGNALGRMLSDDRYYNSLTGGALTAQDAINEVLWRDPPMANYSAHYPLRDVYFHGTWIRAGQLVLVSYAAANTQPAHIAPGQARSGERSHLAWAAGPHACPVKQHALLIATTAIERLTGWLSNIELAVPYEQLVWRPGPFHRALSALPARFTPISPDQTGATPWNNSPSPSTPQAPTSTARQPASASSAPQPS